jgi:hypothetical protein
MMDVQVCSIADQATACDASGSLKPKSKRHHPRSDIGRKHEKLSDERKTRSDIGSKHEKLSDERKTRSDTGSKHEMLSDERKTRSDTGSAHKRRKIQAAPKPTAAQTYGEKYQSELRFLTCACCAFEGPRSGFKSLSSLKERGCLNWHGHSKRTIVQTLMGSSFLYDHRYGMALDTGLDEYGMLPGLKVS